MSRSVKEFLENTSRYSNNPYAGNSKSRSKARYKSQNSAQKPKRMIIKHIPEAEEVVPKDEAGLLDFLCKRRTDPEMPLDDELAIWMCLPQNKQQLIESIRHKYLVTVEEEIKEDPRIQLGLTKRHRYGDDIDILRANFTKSIEEINDQTFELLNKVRVLHHAVMKLNESIPKQTKYRYGSLLENAVHDLLGDCFRIQRKYYRRNMLENMHIELDILRSYFYECSVDYPSWMTSHQLLVMNDLANQVSAIIGGLLKATVA